MASISISSMASGILVSSKPTSMVDSPKPAMVSFFRRPARRMVVAVRTAPADKLSEVVEESIKNAQETCSDNPESGECAAAWDEVEEVSAAASHARDKKKDSDPLETYCKDNPETDECRTYDN